MEAYRTTSHPTDSASGEGLHDPQSHIGESMRRERRRENRKDSVQAHAEPLSRPRRFRGEALSILLKTL